ncbi:unnamed protein product [Boreogadus saida]
MAEGLRKAKKRNFTEVEVETLVAELEARKVVLFSGHGIGIANNKKQRVEHRVPGGPIKSPFETLLIGRGPPTFSPYPCGITSQRPSPGTAGAVVDR